MKLVTFFTPKENIGKTTLSVAVAKMLEEYQKKVCIIDTTSEATLLQQKEQSLNDKNEISIFGVKLLSEFEVLISEKSKEFDIAFIDINSTSGEESIDYLSASDYIYIVSDAESREDFNLDKNHLFKSLRELVLSEQYPVKDIFYLFNKTTKENVDELKISEDTKVDLQILPYIVAETPELENILNRNSNHIISISNLASSILQTVDNEKRVVAPVE